MMYLDFNVGEKTYKLRLTTRGVIAIEKQYGCSPLALFENDEMPKVETLAFILHASLQAYEHGISLNDAYDILDSWMEEGNTITDFVYVILELFKVSGLVPKDINTKPESDEVGEKN